MLAYVIAYVCQCALICEQYLLYVCPETMPYQSALVHMPVSLYTEPSLCPAAFLI